MYRLTLLQYCKPHSFHHQTSLREFTAEEFKAEVLHQPMAGNVDEPEGSLDALMQAMVCRERVGWRQNARKIILMATDRWAAKQVRKTGTWTWFTLLHDL